MNAKRALVALAIVLSGAALLMAIRTPPERVQGDYAKMLFIHVPSVLAAYAAFAVGMVASLVYLVRKNLKADRVAASSIEVGVVFTSLLLVTGMIWGRPTWGVWWDWGDARMVSSAFMLFFYLGYLALRRGVDDPAVRAGRTSVLGVLAFAQVPIVHMSVTWFRTLHQPATLLRPDVENAPIDREFVGPLLMGMAAFLVIYLAMTVTRYRLAVREEALVASELSHEVAGRAITEPNLGGARG
jgi:heme exporter protein C